MSAATGARRVPWRPLATAAYFLAGLVVLDPGIGFLFAVWPPNPWLLSWRHVSSNMVVVSAPMIGMAAVGILLAARVRGDIGVLKGLRLCGLVTLVLSVPFIVLYAMDSIKVYQGLPAPQNRSFVGMEIRMFTVMAIGLALLWMFTRVARGESGADRRPESSAEAAPRRLTSSTPLGA